MADLFGLAAAIWVVAALTAASGVVVAVRMYETHRQAPTTELRSPDEDAASTERTVKEVVAGA